MKKTKFSHIVFPAFAYAALFLFLSIPGSFAKTNWAKKVLGFSSELTPRENSAAQVLGPYSVMPGFGTSPAAWSPASELAESGEWIHLEFEKTDVRQIAIFENFNPGSISRIVLLDTKKKEYTVLEDTINFVPERSGVISYVFLPEPLADITEVKIFLNTSHIGGYNQVDAVALSDEPDSIRAGIDFGGSPNLNYSRNLGFTVNSEYPELAPIVSYDGRKIYFTRQGHPDNIGNEKKQDIWFAEMNPAGKFSVPVNIGPPLNNGESNFLVAISPSENEAYVGNLYTEGGKPVKGISKSSFNGKKWDMPRPLIFEDFRNSSPYASYFIAADNRTMLLSIDDEKGQGNTDIMVSFLKNDGKWSRPQGLGNIINTADNDISPFLAPDGRTLYFSSGGHPGFGSNDIFCSVRQDDTWLVWSKPVNLGPGVNTPGWEGYFTIPARGNTAYFVSTVNSTGAEDIFSIDLTDRRPDPVITVSGKVRDKKSGSPVSAEIIYELLESSEEAGRAVSHPGTGAYAIVLPYGKKYALMAKADNFYSVSSLIDLSNTGGIDTLNADLELTPIEIGAVIKLNNIFFDHGRHELLPGSFSELERVVTFMKSRPSANIEISGHTDDRGDDAVNMELSKNRALEVQKYIIGKGIDKERVTFRFFGKEKPVAGNDTEEGRQLNRRVEFMITKLD